MRPGHGAERRYPPIVRTEYPEGVDLDFRYSAHDAYLLTGGALYHMIGAPIRGAGTLRWSENVGGTSLGVTVDCPLPPG